jgi:hypothetical protein
LTMRDGTASDWLSMTISFCGRWSMTTGTDAGLKFREIS